MVNKAEAELQALLSASSGAVDAGAALARLEETARPADVSIPAGEEADFAMPEALATAVGAGFLLGPIGGLALGVAQGLLGKREKQTVLDQLAAERGVMAQTDDIFSDELDRLAMVTDNPLDLDQLDSLRTSKDAAMRMITSASPGLQQQGADMLAKFNDGLQAYTERQETQQIAAQVEDARVRRELEGDQYSRYNSSVGNFRAESETYLSVMEATDTALNALGKGTPSDLWAAGILVNKALDPTGIVRQEEAEAVGALGDLWTKASVILEKARSGETILPEQRRELSGLLTTIRDTTTRHQLARESRYSDEVIDIGLPKKYHDNFRLVQTVPAANPPEIVGSTPTPDDVIPGLGHAADAVVGAVTDAAEVVRPVDPNEQRSFLERAGVLNTNAAGRRTMKQRGVTYERVDFPDGRFEWQPVEQTNNGRPVN